MAGPQAYLEVARADGAVYVRVHGYGAFSVAKPLRDFAEAGIAAGCTRILIDLGNAASCDSTFLEAPYTISLRLISLVASHNATEP